MHLSIKISCSCSEVCRFNFHSDTVLIEIYFLAFNVASVLHDVKKGNAALIDPELWPLIEMSVV